MGDALNLFNFRPPDMGGTNVRYCLTFLKEVRNNICIT